MPGVLLMCTAIVLSGVLLLACDAGGLDLSDRTGERAVRVKRDEKS